MSRTARAFLLTSLVVAALLALFIGAALVWGVPYDQVSIVIDGQPIDIPPLTTGHWLVASVVILVVLLVLALVLPVVIALALVVPVTLFLAALAFGALGTVLALSPLLLLGWLLWWLWKRARQPAASQAPLAPDRPGPPATPSA